MEEVVCVCGDGYTGIHRSRDVSVESICAGLRRSTEMLSVRLSSLMVKNLFVHLMMGYGPS